MKALIDGDILKYSCGFAVEHKVYNIVLKDGTVLASMPYKKDVYEWCGMADLTEEEIDITESTTVEPLSHAIHILNQKIDGIVKAVGADSYEVYISGADNYRDEIATIKPYKGNRVNAAKPQWFDKIDQYLREKHEATVVLGKEADDQLGIDQYCGDTLTSVICTTDKDLNMIVGWHYNFDKDILYWLNDTDADLWFYCQLIMGDSTDNIQGIPKKGKKAAYNMLVDVQDDVHAMYNVVAEAYNNNDALMENANLLWIQREEGKLWEPPHGA